MTARSNGTPPSGGAGHAEDHCAYFIARRSDARLGIKRNDFFGLYADGAFCLVRDDLTAADAVAVAQASPRGAVLMQIGATFKVEQDVRHTPFRAGDFFVLNPGAAPKLLRYLPAPWARKAFWRLLNECPERLRLTNWTAEQMLAVLGPEPEGRKRRPASSKATRRVRRCTSPEQVSAPIPARSDEGAIFELLSQVGGRMPAGGDQ